MSQINSFNLHIPYLNEKRRIQVYLPKNYKEKSSFPVLYMHDGQNLFDFHSSYSGISWDVCKTLDNFYDDTGIGIIVVGVDNHPLKRLNEYSPWESNSIEKLIPNFDINLPIGGLGQEYNDWFIKMLVPFINKHFKTDTTNNYIAGSSMGGYISLYIGYKNPKVFKAIGAFSTAIWFNKEKLFDFISLNFKKDTKVYLDVGTKETSSDSNLSFSKIYLDDTLDLARLLESNGIKDLLVIVDQDAIHSEKEWSKRFPKFIEWLFN